MALTLWAASLLLVASVPLAQAFTSPAVLLPVGGVVLAVLGVVALARRWRIPDAAVAVAVVACALVAATAMARTTAAAPLVDAGSWRRTTGAGQVLGPVADTVARLLTAPRPAAPALALPVVLLATVVALGVALALGRGASARVAPLVGACVLYGAALLLTAGTADRGPVGVGLVALSVAGWLLLDGDALVAERGQPLLGRALPAHRARWRASGVTGLVLVALVSTAGLASGAAVTGAAFEPRVHVVPPQVPVDAVHPLSEVSRWQSDADATVLRVGGTHPGYLTWVALPDFDGTGWSADLRLRELGSVVEPSLAPGAVRGRVDVEVQLVGLAGPSGSPGTWLPSVGDASATTVPGALTDVDTGVLAAPATADGRLPAGLSYRVRATVDLPEATRAARAGVPAGPEVERYLRVDGLPSDVRAYAQDAVAGARSRLDQADRLAEAVRGERALAADAVSGSSYARLREFLFADASAGGQVGTTEQFAGAFAVLARAVGLPARVVVGFRVPGGAAADGPLRDVHGEDVRAWAEVYLAGTGWVRFDPAPDAASAAGLPAPARELAPEPVQEPASDAAPSDGLGSGASPGSEDGDETGQVPWGLVALVVTAMVMAGLVVVLAAAGLARLAHRRRLRGSGVVGAWQHAAEALALRVGRAEATHTAELLAARIEHLAGVPARPLADAAQQAAFGRTTLVELPDGGVDGQAWRAALDVERRLRAGVPWHRRAAWWVGPAPWHLRRARGRG
ncbi:transglutaminase domain-containing protein [Cellulomonas sp. URHB0016]